MRVAAATALLLTLVTQPQTSFADETGYFGLLRGRDLSPFGFLRLDMRPTRLWLPQAHGV